MFSVVIGWHIYQITGSAWDLGLIGLYQFIPRLLFMLPAGQLADHFNRRNILLLVMGLQCLVLVTFTLLVFLGNFQRSWVFVLLFIYGIAKTFEFPANQAILPNLVGKELLPKAIAFASSGFQMATIIAPALGGFIFMAGAKFAYFFCALFMGIAFLAITLIPIKTINNTTTTSINSAQSIRENYWGHLLAGWHFMRSNKVVLGAISLDLFAVLLGGATALLPAIAQDVLNASSIELGYLRAAPAIGALFVSAYLSKYSPSKNVGKTMFISVIIFGICTIIFGLSHSLYLSMASLIILGGADVVSVVIRGSLIQLETPDEMRGRVSAINSLFIGASNQLGEFESGATATLIGLVPAIVFGGVGTLVVSGLWIKWFPQLWLRNLLQKEN